MHCISLTYGPAGTQMALMFVRAEQANAAFAVVESAIRSQGSEQPALSISDDFGQHLIVDGGVLISAVLEDMERSGDVMIQRALHNARTQARFQTIAAADPALQAAQKMAGMTMGAPVSVGPFGRQ
jgi:hypothetical protein